MQERMQIYCKLAREEIAKLEGLCEQRTVKSMLADVLFLEGRYEEVISSAEALVAENGVDVVSCAVRRIAAKACICLEKYDQAHAFLVGAFQCVDPNDNPTVRSILSSMCGVEYYRKEYEKAIEYGESAIEMNRHFHGCYDYVILSHLALGHKEHVEGLVKQCKLYETPWDASNKQRVEKFCESVLNQL